MAARSGGPDSTHTFLIHPENGIRVVSDSDWSLESLKSFHGAPAAYRVICADGHVRVEGRTANRSCLLTMEPPNAVARRLLTDRPAYRISPPLLPAA